MHFTRRVTLPFVLLSLQHSFIYNYWLHLVEGSESAARYKEQSNHAPALDEETEYYCYHQRLRWLGERSDCYSYYEQQYWQQQLQSTLRGKRQAQPQRGTGHPKSMPSAGTGTTTQQCVLLHTFVAVGINVKSAKLVRWRCDPNPRI